MRAIGLVLLGLLGTTQALNRAVLGFNPIQKLRDGFLGREDYDDDEDWEDEYEDEEENRGGVVSFLAKTVLTAGVATLGAYGAQFAIKAMQKKREKDMIQHQSRPRPRPKTKSLSRQSRQKVQIKGGKGADRATTTAPPRATTTTTPPPAAATTPKATKTAPSKPAATPAAQKPPTPAAAEESAPKVEAKEAPKSAPPTAPPKTPPAVEEEAEEEDNTVYDKVEVVTLDTSTLSEDQKNHPLAQLLGAKVAKFDEAAGKVVESSTADALNGKHVAVCFYLKSYDKAELGRILKAIKESQTAKGNNFEVVLVDLTPFVDPKKVDEGWFQHALKSTGGYAVPNDGIKSLITLFQKVQPKKSPTNVFMAMVDPSGNVIHPAVFLDMQLLPENFPWKYLPPYELVKSTGPLINAKNETVDAKAALEGKVVGLYFSGSWCAPCKEFTKTLKETYQTLLGSDKPFEVVLVPVNDPSPAAYEYLATQPWLSVPPDAALRLTRIISAAEIQAVPTLLIYDEKGELITPHGTARVSQPGAEYPWRPPKVVELSTASPLDIELMHRPCVITFMEAASDETQENLSKVLSTLHEEVQASANPKVPFPGPVQFHTAKKTSDLGGKLRQIFKLEAVSPKDKFLKSKAASNRPILVVLEMFRGRYYVHPSEGELNEETIRGVLAKHKDDTLEWSPLKVDEEGGEASEGAAASA